jgi:hypothetical protein
MLKSIKKHVVQHVNCYNIENQYHKHCICVFLCSGFYLTANLCEVINEVRIL